MSNDNNVECPGCHEKVDQDDLIQGVCPTCHELDDTPTSEECEYCERAATTNICGTNLCDDCLEHYHH